MRFKPYTFKELTEERRSSFKVSKHYNIEWYNKLSEETKKVLEEGRQITKEEYLNGRGNSYDWKTRYSLLENEALVKLIDNNLANLTSINLTSRYSVDKTYEETMRNTLLPILLDRFEDLIEENKQLKEDIV